MDFYSDNLVFSLEFQLNNISSYDNAFSLEKMSDNIFSEIVLLGDKLADKFV